jgi:hypothetical protein
MTAAGGDLFVVSCTVVRAVLRSAHRAQAAVCRCVTRLGFGGHWVAPIMVRYSGCTAVTVRTIAGHAWSHIVNIMRHVTCCCRRTIHLTEEGIPRDRWEGPLQRPNWAAQWCCCNIAAISQTQVAPVPQTNGWVAQQLPHCNLWS